MDLFCFPYAGGSALIYKDWQTYLGKSVVVKPFELAGRGRRVIESNYDSLDEAVEDILESLEHEFQKGSYSLFGHSMGSIIVFRLLHVIRLKKLPRPKHVFLSGSKPPHLKVKSKNDHLLPHDEFIDVLKEYGGTPDEFFENKELMDFFLPRLRDDFRLATSEILNETTKEPLDVNITVLLGDSEDDYSQDDAAEWSIYTNKKCIIHTIPGTHFFINENPHDVISLVKKTIAPMVFA